MEVSAELLGQSEDALRATQEADRVDVLVLRDLADDFSPVAAGGPRRRQCRPQRT